ncbi:hypothetical protein PG993_006875 [Apiospora rasikravindrae]|uniref:Uncharacterized protein n=1 Tax=Apiospora rasikravindrae TaxID=990691 RepID=A0ABR1SXL4_9PEZI
MEYINPSSYFQDTPAGSHTKHVAQEEADRSHLTCKGFLYDKIDGLGCSRDVRVRHEDHDLVAPAHPGHNPPFIVDMKILEKAVWDTITMGAVVDNEEVDAALIERFPYIPNLVEYNFIFALMFHFMFDGNLSLAIPWQRCNQRFEVVGAPLPSFFAESATESYLSQLMSRTNKDKRLHSMLGNVVAFKRIITTARGHVGMAPKASRQGDSIFLLKGCNAPLVLRPNGDGTYDLVGVIYVHGIMNGEAMEMNVVLR